MLLTQKRKISLSLRFLKKRKNENDLRRWVSIGKREMEDSFGVENTDFKTL